MILAKEHPSDEPLNSTLAGFDALIAQCDRERAEHARAISELEERIDHYRRLRDELVQSSAAKTEGATAKSTTHTNLEFFASRSRERTSSTAWNVRKMAFLALKRVGRPLTRAELFEELTAMGMHFTSKDPLRAIGKTLWKAKEFEHTKLGYWIAGETIPASTAQLKRFRSKVAEAAE